MLHPGDEPVLGYRLEKFLGRGSFGEVWRARAPGRTSVALKFISLAGKGGLKEFRAIQRVKEIRHAHLLPIHAIWMIDEQGRVVDDDVVERFEQAVRSGPATPESQELRPSTLVVAMMLADRDLQDVFEHWRGKGESSIPADELLGYLEDVARALDFLNAPRHDLGTGPAAVHHGDIKPQNIMLVGDCAMVCDFGLARVLSDSYTASSLTGTLAFLSPECVSGAGAGVFSDQYSLALTYYWLRTGRYPFRTEACLEILAAHSQGDLHFDELEGEELVAVQRAAALRPDDRFPSTHAFVAALRAALNTPARGRSVRPDSLEDRPGAASPPPTAGGPHQLAIHVQTLEHSRYVFSFRDDERATTATIEELQAPEHTFRNVQRTLRNTGRLGAASTEQLASLGRMLFRVVLPNRLQERLRSQRDTVVIQGNDAQIPWEWLHDGEDFLARRFPLVRSFVGSSTSQMVPSRTIQRMLFVNARPSDVEAGLRPSNDWLSREIECRTLGFDEPFDYLELLSLLDRIEWDVIHFDGGAVLPAGDSVAALSLPDGQVLTGAELSRLLRGDPLVCLDLAMPNAAATGPGEFPAAEALHRLYLTLLTGNCEGHARTVVGSLWWPATAPVTAFWSRFYRGLDQGQSVALAMHAARETAHADAAGGRAWAGRAICGPPHAAFAKREWPGDSPPPPAARIPESDCPDAPPLPPSLGEMDDELPLSPALQLTFLGAFATAKNTGYPILMSIHVLLGLTYIPDGVLCRGLKRLGQDPDLFRRRVRQLIQRTPLQSEETIEVSNNVANALRRARDAAAQIGESNVDERHLLVELFSLSDSSTIHLLRSEKIDLDELRDACEIPAPGRSGGKNDNEGPLHRSPTPAASSAQVGDVLTADGDVNLRMFASPARQSLLTACECAISDRHAELQPSHLLLGMLLRRDSRFSRLMREYHISPAQLREVWQEKGRSPDNGDDFPDPKLHRDFLSRPFLQLLRDALEGARRRASSEADESDLLRALCDCQSPLIRPLTERGVPLEELQSRL